MSDEPRDLQTSEVYFHFVARCDACSAAWCPVPGAEDDIRAMAHEHAAQYGHRVTLETACFILPPGDPMTGASRPAPLSAERRRDVLRLIKAMSLTNDNYAAARSLIDRWDRGIEPEPDDAEGQA